MAMLLAHILLIGCVGSVELSPVSADLDGDVATLVRVRWTQDVEAETWLEFEADGESWSSPARLTEAGRNEELILGVPADTEVTFKVVAERDGKRSESEESSAVTGPLPETLPEPVVEIWEADGASPERWVLGSVDTDGGEAYTGPFWLFIANREGRVVWYHELLRWNMSMFPRVARDGTHIAFDDHSFWDAGGEGALIRRMSLSGDYSEDFEAPGLGWAWDETDEGTLLYDQHVGVPDVTIQEIAADGTRSEVWDCAAWMAAWDDDPEHCQSNTVNWVAETDSIMWSTYWGDYIAEIDRQTGAVLWHAGVLPEGLEIQPAEAALDLQHYPNYTPDGTLIVSTHVLGEEGQQRAREFVVDAAAGTLSEIWAYGEGVEGYAEYSGEAVRLHNGNTLLNYGTGGEIREIDGDGETVWSLQWGDERTLGHSQLVGDLYALDQGR
ncbi:MAG TPA: hypothetical protein QGF58_29660 [Myxococcota bacterium]|nr:hypothetical protein [Myxococcota bacterium]